MKNKVTYIFTSVFALIVALTVFSAFSANRNGRPLEPYWSDQIQYLSDTLAYPNSGYNNRMGRPLYPYWSDQLQALTDSILPKVGGMSNTLKDTTYGKYLQLTIDSTIQNDFWGAYNVVGKVGNTPTNRNARSFSSRISFNRNGRSWSCFSAFDTFAANSPSGHASSFQCLMKITGILGTYYTGISGAVVTGASAVCSVANGIQCFGMSEANGGTVLTQYGLHVGTTFTAANRNWAIGSDPVTAQSYHRGDFLFGDSVNRSTGRVQITGNLSVLGTNENNTYRWDNTSAAPTNPTTPAAWVVVNVAGNRYYMPVYQ